MFNNETKQTVIKFESQYHRESSIFELFASFVNSKQTSLYCGLQATSFQLNHQIRLVHSILSNYHAICFIMKYLKK